MLLTFSKMFQGSDSETRQDSFLDPAFFEDSLYNIQSQCTSNSTVNVSVSLTVSQSPSFNFVKGTINLLSLSWKSCMLFWEYCWNMEILIVTEGDTWRSLIITFRFTQSTFFLISLLGMSLSNPVQRNTKLFCSNARKNTRLWSNASFSYKYKRLFSCEILILVYSLIVLKYRDSMCSKSELVAQ